MILPTTENLFDHKCLFKDMRLSSFNPETLSYYCSVCGGKLNLKRTKEADEYIKKNESLKFSKQLYQLCIVPEEQKKEHEKEQATKEEAKVKAPKTEKDVHVVVVEEVAQES